MKKTKCIDLFIVFFVVFTLKNHIVISQNLSREKAGERGHRPRRGWLDTEAWEKYNDIILRPEFCYIPNQTL